MFVMGSDVTVRLYHQRLEELGRKQGMGELGRKQWKQELGRKQ